MGVTAPRPARVRVRREGLDWTVIDGEVVMVDYRRAKYLRVNSSGAAMWDLLVAGASCAELVDGLQASYGLEPMAASADVEAFLSYLGELDLLEPAE